MRPERLVYDVGMCRGEDTEFYLSRGCRVVGIEANPALVAALRAKFASEIGRGQLHIVDKAISDTPGRVRFSIYPDVLSWGSISAEFNQRTLRSATLTNGGRFTAPTGWSPSASARSPTGRSTSS